MIELCVFVRGTWKKTFWEINPMIAKTVSQCTFFLQLVHLVDLILCTDVHVNCLIKMRMLHS